MQKRFLRTLILTLCFLLTGGCASLKPKFQKSTGAGEGYEIRKEISPQAFSFKNNFRSGVDDKFSISYAYRAVGEECLARGFGYFDVAVLDADEYEGYCYKTADHPALGIEFTERGLVARPQKFIVQSLNGKTKTLLKEGDEILAIEKQSASSVSLFKTIVFRASSAGRKTVALKIRRDKAETEIEIQEPIALFKNSALGPTQLDLVRSRIK